MMAPSPPCNAEIAGQEDEGSELFAAVAVTPALALLAGAVSAQDYMVRDSRGRRVGTVEQGIGERLIQRDASGRRTGTIEPGIGNRLIPRSVDNDP